MVSWRRGDIAEVGSDRSIGLGRVLFQAHWAGCLNIMIYDRLKALFGTCTLLKGYNTGYQGKQHRKSKPMATFIESSDHHTTALTSAVNESFPSVNPSILHIQLGR